MLIIFRIHVIESKLDFVSFDEKIFKDDVNMQVNVTFR